MAINPAQDHKWPIPLDSLLAGSVSPTYQNLSPIAHHISPWQASKDGRFENALYMEYALMQQASHIYLQPFLTYCLLFEIKYQMSRHIEQGKYPKCVRLCTVVV